METVPNREKSSLAGTGALLVSAPRNRQLCWRKLCPDGSPGHRAMFLEVGPPSNVTIRAEGITNPGRFSAAAGGSAVPRW